MQPAPGQGLDLRRLSEQIDALTAEVAKLEEPAPPEAYEPPVPRRIVVAVDGTPGGERALEWAASVAKACGAGVWAISVVPSSSAMDYILDYVGLHAERRPTLFHDEIDRAQRLVGQAAAQLQRAGVPHESIVLEGSPAVQIVRFAERSEADLIVLGTHGQGAMERALLGSVAEAVKNHAPCSVLLAREAPPPARLLLPVDGSLASKRSAALGLLLARAWGSRATLLHVLQLAYAIPEGVREAWERRAIAMDLGWTGVDAQAKAAFGAAAGKIADVATEEGTGLMVMGSRGMGALPSLVAGSVGYRVSHLAPCSVLLAKPRSAQRAARAEEEAAPARRAVPRKGRLRRRRGRHLGPGWSQR